MTNPTRPQAEVILDALNWRYATKQFDITRKLSSEDLDTILEAIRLAPTSAGLQPFQVVVVSDPKPELKSALYQAAREQGQLLSASHILVFCAQPDTRDRVEKLLSHLQSIGTPEDKIKLFQKRSRLATLFLTLTFSRKSWAARQAYIALGFALMTAAELNIDACPMEGFHPGKLARALNLPKGLYPMALLTLGYRSPDDMVRPKYRLPRATLITSR